MELSSSAETPVDYKQVAKQMQEEHCLQPTDTVPEGDNYIIIPDDDVAESTQLFMSTLEADTWTEPTDPGPQQDAVEDPSVPTDKENAADDEREQPSTRNPVAEDSDSASENFRENMISDLRSRAPQKQPRAASLARSKRVKRVKLEIIEPEEQEQGQASSAAEPIQRAPAQQAMAPVYLSQIDTVPAALASIMVHAPPKKPPPPLPPGLKQVQLKAGEAPQPAYMMLFGQDAVILGGSSGWDIIANPPDLEKFIGKEEAKQAKAQRPAECIVFYDPHNSPFQYRYRKVNALRLNIRSLWIWGRYRQGPGLLTAFDMHHTLDNGGEGMSAIVPKENSTAFATVCPVITPWVCSFVGVGHHSRTKDQQEMSKALRLQVATFTAGLAAENGLRSYSEYNSGAPRPGYLFCWIVDNPCYEAHKRQGPYNGKSSALHYYGTHVLFDDKASVCEDCHDSGILCYHIRVKGKAFRPWCLNQNGMKHYSFNNFPQAVGQYIKDIMSGDVMRKLNLVLAHARNCSEDYLTRYAKAARAGELVRDPTGLSDQLFWPEGFDPYGKAFTGTQL